MKSEDDELKLSRSTTQGGSRGDIVESQLRGEQNVNAVKCEKISGRRVLIHFSCNWRSLKEQLMLGMLQKHFDKGIQRIK